MTVNNVQVDSKAVIDSLNRLRPQCPVLLNSINFAYLK